MVTLNRAVAVAMVHGPDAGLALLADARRPTTGWPATTGSHAVRAHLLERPATRAARDGYRTAARRTPAARAPPPRGRAARLAAD